MEKMLLRVLFVSEWLALSACLPRLYHYVTQHLNWTEAQTFCRQTHTDLATFTSTGEINQMLSSGVTSEAWIGLYSNIDWRWSDGFKETVYTNWELASDEPDFVRATQFCVCIGYNGKWWDDECSIAYPFICYRGSQMDPELVLVGERKNFSDAQRYCRDNFTDLATIRNNTGAVKDLVSSEDWAWIGLFRDPNFYWSDRSSFSFNYLDGVSNLLHSMKVVCGVTNPSRSGKWRFLSCDSRLPFVCQSLPSPAASKKQMVKVRLSQDSSVYLESVKAKLLQKLKVELEANGVTGVTLKWNEHPDGTVFHKEKKRKTGV